MFFKLQPILYSLIFLAALEFLAFNGEKIGLVVIFLSVFSFLIVWPLARKIRFLAIPLFLSLGSVFLLNLISSLVEKQVFIALSFAVYYLAVLGAYRLKLYKHDTTAQGMVNLVTLATAFLWFTSNLGWFLNFNVQSWVLSLTFFGSAFLISLPSIFIAASKTLEKNEEMDNKEDIQRIIHRGTVIFLALVLAVIMSQWAWSIALWPFGYLTTGVVTLIIFYVFWDVIRTYLKQEFTTNRVAANIFLLVLLLAGLLMTAEWELIA